MIVHSAGLGMYSHTTLHVDTVPVHQERVPLCLSWDVRQADHALSMKAY